jgi:hypothetical protein
MPPSPSDRPRPQTNLGAILIECGVAVVPTRLSGLREPRQTHAGQVLARLHRPFGEAHLRDVLTILLESEGDELALVAPIITAVSALLLAHPQWWERDASAWLAAFDRVDRVALHARAKRHPSPAA